MNRAFFRFLARSLLWLLAVTLPLQGFASAMRNCCVDELAVTVTVAVEAMQAPQCHDMGDMAGMHMQDQPMKMAMDDGGATHHVTIAAPWRLHRGCHGTARHACLARLDPARAASGAGARFPVRRAYSAWSRTSPEKHALRLTAR